MRHTSEIKDANVGEKIVLFAQKFHLLVVPSPAVLVDTVLTLHQIILLIDKVLPLKSCYNVVQDIQKAKYLARELAVELTRSLPEGEREIRALTLENELRAKGTSHLLDELTKANESAPAEHDHVKALVEAQERENLQARLNQGAQQHMCTEDMFMLACAYLELEVARQGSIYYVRGEASDVKETKRNRGIIQLQDGASLKSASSALSRPDSERGTVERGQIETGFNHIVKLLALYNLRVPISDWIKERDREGKVTRKVDVRSHFQLTITDYETVMDMARRDGLSTLKQRKKDSQNHYSLRVALHVFVLREAERHGVAPNKMLNKIVSDFLRITQVALKKSVKER